MKNALIGAIYLLGGNKPRPEPTQDERRRMEAYDKNQKLYTKLKYSIRYNKDRTYYSNNNHI